MLTKQITERILLKAQKIAIKRPNRCKGQNLTISCFPIAFWFIIYGLRVSRHQLYFAKRRFWPFLCGRSFKICFNFIKMRQNHLCRWSLYSSFRNDANRVWLSSLAQRKLPNGVKISLPGATKTRSALKRICYSLIKPLAFTPLEIVFGHPWSRVSYSSLIRHHFHNYMQRYSKKLYKTFKQLLMTLCKLDVWRESKSRAQPWLFWSSKSCTWRISASVSYVSDVKQLGNVFFACKTDFTPNIFNENRNVIIDHVCDIFVFWVFQHCWIWAQRNWSKVIEINCFYP